MTLGARRAGTVLAVLVVIATLVILDGQLGRAAGSAPSARRQTSATAVVPAGAGLSSWFCAGGSGAAAGAEETVVVTNPTTTAVHGSVTAVSSTGNRRSVSITVPAAGLVTVVPAQVVAGPWVSAVVLMEGGGIGVHETASSPLGWTEAPCASSTATQWAFTGASTAGNDGVSLSLLNPSVTPAVVDTTLVTGGGQVLHPAAYQGVTVPPRSLVTEYLSDHDEGDGNLSVLVRAVTGTVVAAELQSFTAPKASGLSLLLGAPHPSRQWAFPTTEQIPRGQVAFHLYDPGRRPADVTIGVGFAQGQASPVQVVVPAGRAVTVQARTRSQLPVGTPFAATVRSSVPIVASRDVVAPSGGATPARGLSLGMAAAATDWLLPPVTAPGTTVWSLAVQDLAGHPVTVSVLGASAGGAVAVPGLSGVQVQPRVPLVLSTALPAPIGSAPLMVHATGPVAVEMDPEPVGSPGVVVVPPLPVG